MIKLTGKTIFSATSEQDRRVTSLYRILSPHFCAFLHLVSAERLVSRFQRNPCPSFALATLSVQEEKLLMHSHTFLVLICQDSNLDPSLSWMIHRPNNLHCRLPTYVHLQGVMIHIQYLTVGAIIWSLVLISGNLRLWPWQRYPSCRFSSLGFKHPASLHFCVAHIWRWNSVFSQHSAYFFLWPFFVLDHNDKRRENRWKWTRCQDMYLSANSLTPSILNSASSSSVARLLWRFVSYFFPMPVFNPNPCSDIFGPNRSSFSGPLFIPRPWHQYWGVRLGNK